MPVGRIQSLYLNPLSFKEFLLATGYQTLREQLENVTLDKPIEPVLHDKLLTLTKHYMALGGMPAVINEHIQTKDLQNTQQMQTSILASYRLDFGKYANRTNHKYLQKLFEKIPGLIAQHFKYVNVDRDMRARDIKNALDSLHDANLVHFIHSTQASGIPLISLMNEKKFKLLFLDIGLTNRTGQLGLNVLMQEDIMLVNRGALVEQFVGQELLAYQDPFDRSQLFFWQRDERSNAAEIDFVTTVDSTIIPIEVKAGVTGRLKSLQLFMQEKKSPLGIRISQLPLSMEKNILNLPIYMVSEMSRLVRELLSK
jgi:predicted AAA+ superfamily ATPase